MNPVKDLTGNRYGRLVVLERDGSNYPTRWKCLCDCGKVVSVRGGHLKDGGVKSCGCLISNPEIPKGTHYETHTRLYRIWCMIKGRCYRPSHSSYYCYGAKGIKMCEEWKNNYTAFRDWAHNAGYADDLSIERIDINKDYCPENCTWIPLGDQSKNRSTSVVYEYNGKKQILKDWCREYNMPYNSVHSRIKYHGWSFEKALFTPIDKRKSTKGKMEQM